MGSDISSVECSAHKNISEAEASRWLYTPTDVTFITIGVPIVLCIGVGINLTFLFVLIRVPTMRTNTNVFLTNLALADLLFLTLFATIVLWRYAFSPVVFSFQFVNSAGCTLFHLLLETGYYSSVASVTMVTHERYLALCNPLKHLQMRGSQRISKIVLTCWLVGLMLACITIPIEALFHKWCVQWPNGNEYQDLPSTVVHCVPVKPNVIFYSPLLQSGPWFLVMVCNLYMCVKLVQTLVKQVATESTCRFGRSRRTQQRKRQVAVMIIVNGAVFFLCQIPFHAFNIIKWICLIAEIPSPVDIAPRSDQYWLVNFFYLFNIIINPFIYGALNAQYRAAFLEAFGCRCRPMNRRNMPHPPAKEDLDQREDQI
ncbi:growth hormone secretagogue receptor type 1-like [Acanthaster planci]|uniref:Growth hormone secretagogue receptor type 1-like n=1 Tax=Acanthaster planci TaxID=133434 RepID=A0A8B7XXY5_ACAPL|nr:growth hormone secretagogue receptor type 1-like [Acanthaster planci]